MLKEIYDAIMSRCWAACAKLGLRDIRSIAIVGFCFPSFPVNNLLDSVSSRYSEGNLIPVELVRFYKYSTTR